MAKEPIYIAHLYSPFGALVLSTVHNGQRIEQTYFQYGLKEAKRLFKAYLKTLG